MSCHDDLIPSFFVSGLGSFVGSDGVWLAGSAETCPDHEWPGWAPSTRYILRVFALMYVLDRVSRAPCNEWLVTGVSEGSLASRIVADSLVGPVCLENRIFFIMHYASDSHFDSLRLLS